MKIRYGISRQRQFTTECQNHSIEIEGVDWETDEGHQKIREAIGEKHPGWTLSGYVRVNKK